MDELPDCWPPEPHPELPLFALPRFWLFPYVILPVYIFEERYKEMIGDSLDCAGRIVLGTILPGHEEDVMREPPVHEIAGLGEIGRHERLDDGCYQVLLVGLRRVRIQETESDRLYRKVLSEPALEIQPGDALEESLRAQLLEAIEQRGGDSERIPSNVSVSHLSDLLILRMPVEPPIVQQLFAELDVEQRAMASLKLHDQLPELDPPGEEGDEPDPA